MIALVKEINYLIRKHECYVIVQMCWFKQKARVWNNVLIANDAQLFIAIPYTSKHLMLFVAFWATYLE